MDEKPINLKRQRPKCHLNVECIVHYDAVKDDKFTPLTAKSLASIQNAARIRQSFGCTDYERQHDICKSLPSTVLQDHGYHRICYQRFTSTSRLQKRKSVEDHSGSEQKQKCSFEKRKRSHSSSYHDLLPQTECIFCGKRVKKTAKKFEDLKKIQSKTREDAIKSRAEDLQNSKIMSLKDVDLVAKEARYHLSCYHHFIPPEGPASKIDADKDRNLAHEDAFRYICKYVEDSIIHGNNVERITMLKEKYLWYMYENHHEFYNNEYKTDKLKKKLIKHFGQKILFWRPNFRSELVYSSSVPSGQAVEAAFEAAASDSKVLEEAALILRRTIMSSYSSSEELPWPPPPGKIIKDITPPPTLLQYFIECLITGKTKHRIIDSLCHDIMYAVTNGQWVTSKHLLLAITLWHLTGKAEIITLLNRFGHSVSYSRVLEALTAVFIQVKEHPGPLPPNIDATVTSLVHFWFDNFDLQEETPSGKGTTHTTHGLICQEKATIDDVDGVGCNNEDRHGGGDIEYDKNVEVLSVKPKLSVAPKLRSVKYVASELPPCYVKKRQAPPKFDGSEEYMENNAEVINAHDSDLLWILTRQVCFQPCEDLPQIVPGWKGWVSCTGTRNNESLTSIEYLPPIPAPITENSTVQECLTQSQTISNVLKQSWTIVCFDMAAAKKAYAIKWQYPEKFPKLFIRLGAFHTICAYWGAVWKSMEGSGVAEIIIQSDICASGSIKKVLSGKHYNRCRYVLKTLLESLQRLLFEQYEIHYGKIAVQTTKMLKELAKDLTYEKLEATLKDPLVSQIIDNLKNFEEEVRRGKLGKTAMAWMQFMDKVFVGLEFFRATAENNLDLHISSLRKMCITFFNMDRPNYARYGTYYYFELINADPELRHLLEEKGISINRSSVPSSRNAIDLTGEQTYNRHAAGSGSGIIGFSRNLSAYFRWQATRHFRAEYCETVFDIAEMGDQDIERSSKHKDLRKAELRKSEEAVQRTIKTFKSFLNPFNTDRKDELICISSGVPVHADVAADILDESPGERAMNDFILSRLKDNTVNFHDPIPKRKRSSYVATLYKSVTSKNKTLKIKAQRNVFGQLVNLAGSHNLSLEAVLSYELGVIPWALSTPDGCPLKTDKSALLHAIEKDFVLLEKPKNAVNIIDAGGLIQSLSSIPETYEDLCLQIFNCLPRSERVDFVCDAYQPNSIKSIERRRRGMGVEITVRGSLQKTPKDFKEFLSNDKNKSQLYDLVVKEWQSDKYASKISGRQVIISQRNKCYKLVSDGIKVYRTELENLCSNQEEADTRMMLHVKDASQSNASVIIRSPDTDVFLLLLSNVDNFNGPVYMDTGSGDHRRILDIGKIRADIGDDVSKSLLGLHAFTGSDTTSAFMRKGKTRPLKIMQGNDKYINAFKKLGETEEVPSDVCKVLEEFTCIMYGFKPTAKFKPTIDKCRYQKFIERFTAKKGVLSTDVGVDISLLPPCHSSLLLHIKRSNYQTAIWRRALEPQHHMSEPSLHGWIQGDEGLEIQWTHQEMMPPDLVSIVVKDPQILEDDAEVSELESPVLSHEDENFFDI